MHVVIAGAGIGGLTLALALHKRQIPCTVYEAVPELRPLGVGINLLPHSVQQLTELGLLDRLAETAIATASLSYYNKHGQLIWSEPRGLAAGYPCPQFSIHRGELQMILLAAVKERLGEEAVHTGHTLLRFAQEGGRVQTTFSRGDGAEVLVESDVLAAADGIHSVTRKQMFPDEGPPRYGQRVLWRSTTEGEPFGDGRSMFMAGYQDVKFVAYPISRKLHEEQGRSRINWIAELTIPGDTPPRHDWNKQVPASLFEGPFQGWRWPWIDIPALIRGGGAIYEFPLVDRDPLPAWSQGHVTLMGDAAHPMYPIGSNGASQAILDVRALADALAGHGSIETALQAYEQERRPKTAAIVLANRGNGPEQVMQMAEDRAPQGYQHINDVIPQAELEEVSARYKQIAGFAKHQLKA